MSNLASQSLERDHLVVHFFRQVSDGDVTDVTQEMFNAHALGLVGIDGRWHIYEILDQVAVCV